MVKDHKVRRRRYEDEIKISADCWRDKLCGGLANDDFSVTRCAEALTKNKWIRAHGTREYHELQVRFYAQDLGQPPAYVEHNPTILHCDLETWGDAKIGEPKARFIEAGVWKLGSIDTKRLSLAG